MISRLDGGIARSNESNQVLLNGLLGRTFEHGDRRRARFSALIGVHRPVPEAVARKLCREPAAAADLVQDTLERAWLHIPDATDATDATRLHRAHARLRELLRRRIATAKHAGRPPW